MVELWLDTFAQWWAALMRGIFLNTLDISVVVILVALLFFSIIYLFCRIAVVDPIEVSTVNVLPVETRSDTEQHFNDGQIVSVEIDSQTREQIDQAIDGYHKEG